MVSNIRTSIGMTVAFSLVAVFDFNALFHCSQGRLAALDPTIEIPDVDEPWPMIVLSRFDDGQLATLDDAPKLPGRNMEVGSGFRQPE